MNRIDRGLRTQTLRHRRSRAPHRRRPFSPHPAALGLDPPGHLAATAWILLERPGIVLERDLPGIIARYNESVGGVNDATLGYHETITQFSIRAVRRALARSEGEGLAARVDALLQSPEGRRDWPLRFYSAKRLFSKEARLGWVEPDLAPLEI